MQHRSLLVVLMSLTALAMSACDTALVERPVQVKIDPQGGDFWDLPLPSDLRQQDDGSYALSTWPNAKSNDYVEMWLDTADKRLRAGWGLSSGAFIALTGKVAPETLPADGAASITPNASVFLLNIDPRSPNRGQRIPIDVSFLDDTDEFSPPHAIAAIPLFGFIREPSTTYAMVVTDLVRDLEGERLGRSQAFHDAFRRATQPSWFLRHAPCSAPSIRSVSLRVQS